MKVLIVDDMETNRQLLSWMLEDDGYEVVEACDGQQAVDAFKTFSPGLIIMDVMMPGMDGFEATRQIRQMRGDVHVPIIFLTALNDENSLSQCIAAGGDDFLSKPFNEIIFSAKVKAHVRNRELSVQINEKNKVLQQYQYEAEKEHIIVDRVFERALADSQLDHPNINYFQSPMSNFNGDILLSAVSPRGGLYMFLGDFTGHGLSAAIGGLPISRKFFELVEDGLAVGDLAREINKLLFDILPEFMFCAAAIIELNRLGDTLSTWVGGLPDGLILDKGGRLINKIASQHMPLGVLDNLEFEDTPQVYRLNQNENVLFYSDGLIETNNEKGELFGEERLDELFLSGADIGDNIVEYLVGSIDEYDQEGLQDDDVSILQIKCLPMKHEEEFVGKMDLKFPWCINIELGPDNLKESGPINEVVNMLGGIPGISPHKDYLFTVLSELYINALDHGVLGLDSKIKDGDDGILIYQDIRQKKLDTLDDGKVNLAISLAPRVEGGGSVLNITLSDSGDGFDFDNLNSCEEEVHGRGIGLVNEFCESVLYSDNGSKIEVAYRISS